MKIAEKFSVLSGWQKDWKMLVLAGALSFGFVSLIGYFDKPAESRPADDGIDTLIPPGFLLIPIEVQNYDSLDSLLGKYGIVDLFRGEGKNGRLVARDVRILRAPNNPSHFAVLAPESQAAAILSREGNFYVAIKAPNKNGTQIVNEPPAKPETRRIHFDGE